MIAKLLRAVIPKRFRPIGYLEHLAEQRSGGCVGGGPFAGTRYIRNSVGSAYVPKLLGIYERELNQCIEEACALNFPLIVDIGAAEGYYAVGLARRNPTARVIAFETDAKGQTALKQMVQLNDVASRVETRGMCELKSLQSALSGADRSFIVCDVEGDEERLLDPERIPELQQALLLVEMHDFISRGITERMRERFAATHTIETIWQDERNRKEMQWRTLGTTLLPRRYLDWAVSEWRPEQMCWLWMEPR